MAIKNLVSYVPGNAGDFVVNCCNGTWHLDLTRDGTATNSASIKTQENLLGDTDLQHLIDDMPFDYIGCHHIDRLLRMHVRPIWLGVPDRKQFRQWVLRDAATRRTQNLLTPHGRIFDLITMSVRNDNINQAIIIFMNWLENFNWTLMQMRLVQSGCKIDVSSLLDSGGMDALIQQMPQLDSVADQCRQYHQQWLAKQLPFEDHDWMKESLGSKLQQLVLLHDKH